MTSQESITIEQADALSSEIRKQWRKDGITAAPNTGTSLMHWIGDCCIAITLFLFFSTYATTLQTYLGYTGSCILAAVVQGTAWTGLWVLGHECGHGAFSANKAIETTVGYLTHTALLVPYFSWQFTHAKHHHYTNHLTKGETHVPPTKKDALAHQPILETLGEDGFAFFQLFTHLVFGWPAYLFSNETGGRTKVDLKTRLDHSAGKSHFLPCQVFPKAFNTKVYSGTIGCITMVVTLIYLQFNNVDTWYHYWFPYLVVNGWLVLYTWLQHTDPSVPHFGDDEHTFSRGALSTIDRPYPWLIDCLHHHIGSTHIAHHLCHRIPHYRAQAATKILKNVLGKYYNFVDTPIPSAALFVAKTCHYVDGVTGIQYLHPLTDAVNNAIQPTQKSEDPERRKSDPPRPCMQESAETMFQDMLKTTSDMVDSATTTSADFMEQTCKLSADLMDRTTEFVRENSERSAELMEKTSELMRETSEKVQDTWKKGVKALDVRYWFFLAIGLYIIGSCLISLSHWIITPIGFIVVAFAMNQFYRCGYSCSSVVPSTSSFTELQWARWVVGQLSLLVVLRPMSSMYLSRPTSADADASRLSWVLYKIGASFNPRVTFQHLEPHSKHPFAWLALQFCAMGVFVCIFFPALVMGSGFSGLVRHWLIPFLVLHYQLGSFSREGGKAKTILNSQDFFRVKALKTKIVKIAEYKPDLRTKAITFQGKNYRAGPHWFNIVYLTLVHLGGLYGFYLGLTVASWDMLIIAFGFYQYSGLGITAGAHRLWAHRTYSAHPIVQVFLILANSMANQGSVYKWARDHRVHHKHVDTPKDPHNARLGFWYSHVGWLFSLKSPEVLVAGKHVFMADLEANPIVMFQHRAYPLLGPLMCFVVPALVGGYFTGDYILSLWVCGFARYVWILHVTWFVNSLAHLWGTRPYLPNILPVENLFVSIMALGEGWHNFHHAYPYDYSTSEYGLWKWNPTTVFLDFCALLGLVYDRRVATVAGKGLPACGKGACVASQPCAPCVAAHDQTLPAFTKADVQASANQAACVLIIGDYVYDVASFLEQKLHPGGNGILSSYMGKDATTAFFRGAKHAHTEAAISLLRQYKIGRFVHGVKQSDRAAVTTDGDFKLKLKAA